MTKKQIEDLAERAVLLRPDGTVKSVKHVKVG